jgi:hypothetical protein
MGQAGSAKGGGDQALESVKAPTPEELARQISRAKLRIRTFRLRAGAEEICGTVLQSWTQERARILRTWESLSDPARRGLVMSNREKVVRRARVLHSVIAPRALNAQQQSRAVRTLMEKVSFELFDTNILYDSTAMPTLIEDILQQRGGGPDVPFGLALEVERTFSDEVRRFSQAYLGNDASEHNSVGGGAESDAESKAGRSSPGAGPLLRNLSKESNGSAGSTNGGGGGGLGLDLDALQQPSRAPAGAGGSLAGSSLGLDLDALQPQQPSKGLAAASVATTGSSSSLSSSDTTSAARRPSALLLVPPACAQSEPASRQPSPVLQGRSPSGSGLVNSRSASSLQGYYHTTNAAARSRRNSGSRTIHTLLAFIPNSGMDPISRKELTVELLLEMRNAFLVHFAVLMVSELYDEQIAVKDKYESDMDTDVQSETDQEEDGEEEEEDDVVEGVPPDQKAA